MLSGDGVVALSVIGHWLNVKSIQVCKATFGRRFAPLFLFSPVVQYNVASANVRDRAKPCSSIPPLITVCFVSRMSVSKAFVLLSTHLGKAQSGSKRPAVGTNLLTNLGRQPNSFRRLLERHPRQHINNASKSFHRHTIYATTEELETSLV